MTNTKKFHPRSFHNDQYDFKALIKSYSGLKEFVKPNKYGNLSIDFSNPNAVIALNKSLLSYFYKVQNWSIPKGYLCPPIPSRADYIHYIADLLNTSGKTNNEEIIGLDVGVGANCIYPIVCSSIYNWKMYGSDIEEESVNNARNIVKSNENLKDKITILFQENKNHIFKGVLDNIEKIDFTVCNPPFHKSLKEAISGNTRKVKNLTKNQKTKSSLNFGGKNNELWCNGGELKFIEKMIKESSDYSDKCIWFTTLVSKKENINPIKKTLNDVKAKEIKIIEMSHGQKITRIIAWSFIDKNNHKNYFNI